MLDAFGNGDFERAAPVLADHFAPGGVSVGIEQYIESRRAWREHHTEVYHIDNISAESGNRVIYLASLTETHVGMYYGYPPTGDEITVAELGVLGVVDGVSEHRQAFDTNDFFVQMGMIPNDPYQAKVEKQFYEVVNRVLRHNLRNDLSTIEGYADLIGDIDDNTADYARRIQATTDDLLTTAEKIRTYERQVLGITESHPVELDSLIRSVVAQQQDVYSDCEFSITGLDE